MPHKTFTHKDLAKQLGVSETTVKSYRRKFPGCIPLYSQGKPIRFNHNALAVCKKIRDLFEQGMSIEEVRNRLMVDFSWIEPAEDKVQSSEELKPANASVLSTPALPAKEEQKEFYAKPDSFISLPQSFTTAISGLAKSVVALTRQQSIILERLTGLEEKITPKILNDAPTQDASLPAQMAAQMPGQIVGQADFFANDAPQNRRGESLNSDFLANPKWADDLASRLEGMEQALVRTLASFEGQLNASQELGEGERANAALSFEAGKKVDGPENSG